MGQLVNGEWIKGSISNNAKDGGFKRLNSVFRNNISEDHDIYRAESKRYHLYVAMRVLGRIALLFFEN